MTLQRNRFKVGLFQTAMRFAGWLAGLPNRMVPPPFRLIQLGSAYWLSRSLYVAAEWGVADMLGDQRMAVDELAARLNANEDSLYRLLRMLAANEVFIEVEPRTFSNSRLSHCLRDEHPQSVRAMVRMHNSPEMARPWFETLEQGICRGEPPFVLTHGCELFSFMDSNPEFDALFTRAMDSVESLTGTDYLQDLDWSRFERIIDVGGSRGQKALAILQHQPGLRALVFDRQQVVEHAPDYWHGRMDKSVLERVEFVGGDMLEGIPAAESDHDLYLFVAVFHGMGDEEARRVLARLGEAIGSYRPTVVIVDMVMPAVGADASTTSFDMQMLANTRGRERTLNEWGELLSPSGFNIDEEVVVRTFPRMLVVKKS